MRIRSGGWPLPGVLAGLSIMAACMICGPASATPKGELSDKTGQAHALQQVVRNERPPGPVFIAIPAAYVFGMGGNRGPLYCSPSIRAINSSNTDVDELIVGIDYDLKGGGQAGGSVTRFRNVAVGTQDTNDFYQLSVSACQGIEGRMKVIRCVYTSGVDCTKDVQAIGYGAIPLRFSQQ